jgi:hypothetical protein
MKTLRQQIESKCIHFNGLMNECCEAGVRYQTVKVKAEKGMRFPCKSWQGIEECPVCKGRLRLSHAAYNGHVHGRCETEGCLAWME